MKRCYWSGEALIQVFLKGPRCDFLLNQIEKCGTAHTAACAKTEFRLAVAKADRLGLLRPGGSAALRSAFDDAVRLRRIILIDGDASGSIEDELTEPGIREKLELLEPLSVVHLATASKNRFRYFVAADEKFAPLCRVWGLRPVTPVTDVAKVALSPYKNRLERFQNVIAKLQSYRDELRAMEDDATVDTNALGKSLTELRPIKGAERIKTIEDAETSFFECVDELDSAIERADSALGDWMHVTKLPGAG